MYEAEASPEGRADLQTPMPVRAQHISAGAGAVLASGVKTCATVKMPGTASRGRTGARTAAGAGRKRSSRRGAGKAAASSAAPSSPDDLQITLTTEGMWPRSNLFARLRACSPFWLGYQTSTPLL